MTWNSGQDVCIIANPLGGVPLPLTVGLNSIPSLREQNRCHLQALAALAAGGGSPTSNRGWRQCMAGARE